MKIRLLSDLHCEGWKFNYEYEGEDVLILAGDIHTKNRLHTFLAQIPSKVSVLMVLGNHESYSSVYEDVVEYHNALHANYPNFTFLNNSSTIIHRDGESVNFFGGQMCTAFHLYGLDEAWSAKKTAQTILNDFIAINKRVQDEHGGIVIRKWATDDHELEYYKFVSALKPWLLNTEGTKRVVISHFAPHPITCEAKYGTHPVNAYFTEDMSDYIGWDGLWVFGHTHSCGEWKVGDTRLITNAKGYGKELEKSFDSKLIITV